MLEKDLELLKEHVYFHASDVDEQAAFERIKNELESAKQTDNMPSKKCLCDTCSETNCCAEYSLGIRAIKCRDYMQS